MQKKRKILWICVAWACAILVFIGFMIHFMFRLKNVDVEFQSRLAQSETRLDAGIQSKVRDYFISKDNIILKNFDDTINRVESENPYIKINQVIKVFPNTVRVYISERIPKFKVKNANNSLEWLVLDEDFKVLSVVSENEESKQLDKFIEISTNNLIASNSAGEFISPSDICKQFVNQIAAGIYGVSEDFSIVKSIEYKNLNDQYIFNLRMKNKVVEDENGCLITIKGDDRLIDKTFAGVKVFEDSLSDGTFTNNKDSVITVYYDDERLVVNKN